MFHVKQFVVIYDNVPRETMQNVPRETFFSCFLPVGGLSGADWRGDGWRRQKWGKLDCREKGGKLAVAHRAAVDSSQGGGR